MAEFDFGSLVGPGIGAITGLIGGKMAADASAKNARLNMAMQTAFAQHGISWKVADAIAAGVHPLAALGAQTQSFSPVTVGEEGAVGKAVAQSGQDIGRAIAAGSTRETRESVMMTQLNLKRAELQNELLATQIAKMRGQLGPPMPGVSGGNNIDGQGDSGVKSTLAPVAEYAYPKNAEAPDNPLKFKATEAETSTPASGGSQAHWQVPDAHWAKTATGWAPVPSEAVSDRSNSELDEWRWAFRNQLIPSWKELTGFGGGNMPHPPMHVPVPPGMKWKWAPYMMEWQLVPVRRRNPRNNLPNLGYPLGG